MVVDPERRYGRRAAARFVVVWGALTAAAWAGPQDEALLEATRKGDLAGVKKALEAGGDVNARSPYGATPLSFAADKGHTAIVRLLLDGGADVNSEDAFYHSQPITWAARNGHVEVVKLLLEHGASFPQELLLISIARKQMDIARAIITSGRVEPEWLRRAMMVATQSGNQELVGVLDMVGAKRTRMVPTHQMAKEALKKFEGTYRSDTGLEFEFVAQEGVLIGYALYQQPLTFRPVTTVSFQGIEFPRTRANFKVKGGRATHVQIIQRGGSFELDRVKTTDFDLAPVADVAGVEKPMPWPSFRGDRASGVADGQHPPVTWDVAKGENVRWKTPIPGLAHSSPIVWGDQVFVTTVVSSDPDPVFRHGIYTDVDSASDDGTQSWHVYCLDKLTGKIVWDKLAHEGTPRSRRHLKSSHANSTPATDGTHLVVSFGSEGLYCYDFEGALKWRVDLGDLDSGWFYDPEYQWGYASSPIIHDNLVIVQADVDRDPYLAAFRLDDGTQVWRTPREEIPSWSTPTIFETSKRTDLVVNATKYVRGYDPRTGKELWRLGRNSEITVAAPVTGNDLVFVTGGYMPIRPIYAIRAGATGDVSLAADATSNAYVAWANLEEGTYIPTPIVYRDLLYTFQDNGQLTCYEAATGAKGYSERLGGGRGGGFAASPIAADGRLYFFSEDGDVYVVEAGSEFRLLAHNSMEELCMATPAISDGMLIVRARKHVYGLGRTSDKSSGAGD